MLRKLVKVFLLMAFIAALGFAALYVYFASKTGKRAVKLPIFLNTNNRKLVIAHRGGSALAPENTLEAFDASTKVGADVLELDVRQTKDGHLVVFHDATIERTTNGKGKISELTLEQVKALDAGYNWSRDGKTFPFRNKGVKVPELKEVFERFPQKLVNAEAKFSAPSPAMPICDLIKSFRREDKTIFAAISKSVQKQFRAECPNVATSASAFEGFEFLAMYKMGLISHFSAEMQALQIPFNLFGIKVVDKSFIEAAHARGLQIHVFTVNNSEEISKYINSEVDGIMTDRPDVLVNQISNESGKTP